MKELDREVSYDVRDLNENQLREFKKECVDQGATGVFNDAHNKDYNDLIRVNKISVSNSIFDGKWCIVQGFEGAINALTLFEPQFKQGDKVLVSNDNENWCERVFVLEYKTLHYCELPSSHNDLIQWKYIKPYEDEIKIGYWVKNTDEKELILVTKDMNLKCLNNESEYIKITNPQLIELLNKEL